MIQKTRGIVFRFTKYGETSIIVTIFTEVFGLQSYIVNGVRSKAAKNKIALYQPLTLLNLVVYHRPHANLERIKEVQCLHPYASVTSEIRKSSIALFINELLNKTVKEESHVQDLFEFISSSLITLDTMPTGYENFHLLFMIKLSRYLGFGAQHVNEIVGGRMATPDEEEMITTMLTMNYTDSLPLSNEKRRVLTDLLLKFYLEHMETIGEIRSLQVLKEIFQ